MLNLKTFTVQAEINESKVSLDILPSSQTAVSKPMTSDMEAGCVVASSGEGATCCLPTTTPIVEAESRSDRRLKRPCSVITPVKTCTSLGEFNRTHNYVPKPNTPTDNTLLWESKLSEISTFRDNNQPINSEQVTQLQAIFGDFRDIFSDIPGYFNKRLCVLEVRIVFSCHVNIYW